MHLTFLITEKNFQKQVIFKNLIVNVTTNQYQYKMKNVNSKVHFGDWASWGVRCHIPFKF
jgi:hypothetical protein